MFIACEMFAIHKITIAYLCEKYKQFVKGAQKCFGKSVSK